jgi:hypothetical protein
VPCSSCGEQRCDCISSVLDALDPAAAPVREEAPAASRPRPPAPVWPPPAPPPPGPPPPAWPWGAWPDPGYAAALPWRGGAPGLYAGRRRYDLLVADDRIVLVPAGPALERSLLVFGLVGALVGGSFDRTQGNDRMRRLLSSPPPAVLGAAGVRVVVREQVQAVHVIPRGSGGSATVQLRGGERLRLRWTGQPHVPALLQASFGALATVGPRPAWHRALRVAGIVVAVLLAVSLGTLLVATQVDRDRTAAPTAAPSTTTPGSAGGSLALQACRATSEAFYAPRPEQGAAFDRAAGLMEQAAATEPRYQRAVEALRWFQVHLPTGVLYSVEADPRFEAVSQACTPDLGADPAAPSDGF